MLLKFLDPNYTSIAAMVVFRPDTGFTTGGLIDALPVFSFGFSPLLDFLVVTPASFFSDDTSTSVLSPRVLTRSANTFEENTITISSVTVIRMTTSFCRACWATHRAQPLLKPSNRGTASTQPPLVCPHTRSAQGFCVPCGDPHGRGFSVLRDGRRGNDVAQTLRQFIHTLDADYAELSRIGSEGGTDCQPLYSYSVLVSVFPMWPAHPFLESPQPAGLCVLAAPGSRPCVAQPAASKTPATPSSAVSAAHR